jgi:hypothetical protein
MHLDLFGSQTYSDISLFFEKQYKKTSMLHITLKNINDYKFDFQMGQNIETGQKSCGPSLRRRKNAFKP